VLRSFLVLVILYFTQLSLAQETAPDSTTTAIMAEPFASGTVLLAEGDVRFFDEDRQVRRPKVDNLHLRRREYRHRQGRRGAPQNLVL